jgi:hypothetical protein
MDREEVKKMMKEFVWYLETAMQQMGMDREE